MKCIGIVSVLLGATLVASAALPSKVIPRSLGENDVILTGDDGRVEVMDRAQFNLLLSQSNSSWGLDAPTPLEQGNWTTTPTTEVNATQIESRCSQQTIFTMGTTSTFLNWDVPMSSVVHAGANTATVAVTQGYQIANTVGVTIGATLTVIKDFLQESLSINYSETWTSTYAAAYTYTVPAGKYGIVVSNPQTTRHTGHVNIGCVGQATQRSDFQADSYSSQSYGSLSWVKGVISLCTGDTYPVPRCIGGGTLS
jgi:hypothetical protein